MFSVLVISWPMHSETPLSFVPIQSLPDSSEYRQLTVLNASMLDIHWKALPL